MTDNTIIVTRTLDAREMERLRRKLRELWPGEEWTVMHGQVLRDVATRPSWVPMPAEWKDEGVTATPVPRFEG